MKTYWFTIASGPEYHEIVKTLALSCQKHGIDLHILEACGEDGRAAKHRKIDGILNAPEGVERIVFLDADTAVLDPQGIDAVSGSWRMPWRMPTEDSIPRGLDVGRYAPRLLRFYRNRRLEVFCPGGLYEGIEWNSGVIAGSRKAVTELALQWDDMWRAVEDVFDGNFRRDQVSYKLAYWKVFVEKYRCAGLPAAYNWCASYFGINPNAHILHRNMLKGVPWLDEGWARLSAALEAGSAYQTQNRVFDMRPVVRETPCRAGAAPRFDRDAALTRLGQTVAHAAPRHVLVVGPPSECEPVLAKLKRLNPQSVDPQDAASVLLKARQWDMVVYTNLEYVGRAVPPSFGVGCFFRARQPAFFETLFSFSFVRFIDANFGLFSDSGDITGWNYEESCQERPQP